jgi:hypothetical protein
MLNKDTISVLRMSFRKCSTWNKFKITLVSVMSIMYIILNKCESTGLN